MADVVLPGGKRRIDRVLSEGYLDGLAALPLPDVRVLRDEAEQEEVDLSYLRRLLQGKADILGAEVRRRADGGEGGGSGDLLAMLPAILAADAPRTEARGLGRHTTMEPSRVGDSERWVEALVADDLLATLGTRSHDELAAAVAALAAAEETVSSRRRDVHQVLDVCSAEITRRYREGEADITALLVEGP